MPFDRVVGVNVGLSVEGLRIGILSIYRRRKIAWPVRPRQELEPLSYVNILTQICTLR